MSEILIQWQVVRLSTILLSVPDKLQPHLHPPYQAAETNMKIVIFNILYRNWQFSSKIHTLNFHFVLFQQNLKIVKGDKLSAAHDWHTKILWNKYFFLGFFPRILKTYCTHLCFSTSFWCCSTTFSHINLCNVSKNKFTMNH